MARSEPASLLSRFPMKYATLAIVVAVSCGWIAIRDRGVAWILLWPAISFAIVALGYARRDAGVFGKQPDGTMAFWRVILLAPYLLLVWLAWHLIRMTSSDVPVHQVRPGLYIGRRLLPSELPSDVELIIDLTCELTEPRMNRRDHDYWSIPILDASIPDPDQARHWAAKLVSNPRATLIHCAQGYGRTGTFAAILLLLDGTAPDADAAFAILKRARPRLRLNRQQELFVRRLAARIPGEPQEIEQGNGKRNV